MIPDFTQVPLENGKAPAAGAGRATSPDWDSPEGIAVKPLYTAADLADVDFLRTYPGIAPYLRGPYPTMYVTQPWTIRQYAGLLHRGGVERVLPAQPRGRAEGPVDRVRPGHPPRLRLRPPAGGRRRRHGGGGDRLDLRHAPALRRHPAGRDVGVDDDERRRAAGARALHRGGRGAGRAAREAHRDHPERHPQGVHGPQHLHLPAAAVDADHLRHLRATPRGRCRSSTRSPSPATTSRRPGPPPTSSWPTPSPTAWSTCGPGSTPAWTSTGSRRGCRSSSASA